jgi:hypothetical protein
VTQLPPITPELAATLALAAAIIALLALAMALMAARRARRLDRQLQLLDEHYHVVMKGADGQNLAAALEAYARRLQASENRVTKLEARAENLDSRLQRAITRLQLIRYRAFEDAGGDQSFTLALLDETDNGAIVTGIHGRGGVRVYGKPIAAGSSSYNLTAEEKQAIAAAAGGDAG